MKILLVSQTIQKIPSSSIIVHVDEMKIVIVTNCSYFRYFICMSALLRFFMYCIYKFLCEILWKTVDDEVEFTEK